MLAEPDRISKAVLARRLDAQTAFEIVSIDIADIDVGDNIGARLQADQAEADMRVAALVPRDVGDGGGARAGNDRTDRGKPAKLVEADAEVPKAIADAIRDHKLGILDYYKLRNVQADTEMRTAIAGGGTPARNGQKAQS